ncbi:unnamed protein product [Angiostrongylus costaricensis]|uniref:EGF-like domain-containing protein n=1 Tax=Angiostrongylus costaricensis TaxID=334426 RepID=A0A0R3Q0D8_ANGCS|nr:unnamed protein product [Angiostrongylus costaricensis]
MARVDALVMPRQCNCVNGGICKLDGSCECSSDFEGENCQKSNTVSRKVGEAPFGFGTKNEAADSTVSFHGNVISFSNPALDSKQDGSCSMARVDALVMPRQCNCVNGGICKLDGSCECSSDFEGENCQKSNTVSRKVGEAPFGFGTKNEAADSTVSFHGNVISFSNPALDSKQDPHPIEYSMQQISSLEPGSTTFSNPVYDLETDSTAVLPIENTPSTSHLASFHSRDRTGGDVIGKQMQLKILVKEIHLNLLSLLKEETCTCEHEHTNTNNIENAFREIPP